MPHTDPASRENHPSWPAYALYRTGAFMVNLWDRVNALSDSEADAIKADAKRTRRWGVATVASTALVGSLAAYVWLDDDSNAIHRIREDIEGCIADVESYVPAELQEAYTDECEAPIVNSTS